MSVSLEEQRLIVDIRKRIEITCHDIFNIFMEEGAFPFPIMQAPVLVHEESSGVVLDTYYFDFVMHGQQQSLVIRNDWLADPEKARAYAKTEAETARKRAAEYEESVVRPKELAELKRLLEKYGQSLRMEQYSFMDKGPYA